MRILGQVIEIYPLHVVISLPNQMLGHIPLPQVTHQLTERIEKLPDEGYSDDEEASEEGGSPEDAAKRIPELQDIFMIGQYVQTVVTTVHAAGATAPNADLGKPRNATDRGSRRIVLSTSPKDVNREIPAKDLSAGYVGAARFPIHQSLSNCPQVIAGAVKSVEDHGYVLDLGVDGVSGFLSFKDAKQGPWGTRKLSIGSLVQTCVRSVSPNRKVCTVTVEESTVSGAKVC
jgi:rRNA biogenesis protein RRP5